ncbi:Cytochrome c oxidase polypeptide II [Arcticibacter svalbardensis MN12-7]|uniref:Cytochrome c oxidase subunit 2 n=1 Tax=Arcticibacter svalbardensis MN12-7 TaxID=1150600 RepID=R9GTQ7_9SPHI|nr:cytochrome c oxidase subunit II [Arcticibacter svalbardensis]EOR95222.1 Cytochrome c oxidase polypeptide II [Arcticibacter svalbardensis MN12-7]
MRFNTLFKIRNSIAVLAIALMAFSTPLAAQDTTAVISKGVTGPVKGVAADNDLDAFAKGLANISADATTSDAATDTTDVSVVANHNAVYKSAGFYSILFILVCIFIAITGKILRVYEITREIQGKKAGLNWNNIQGVILVLFLILGLYGTYWSYNTWGWVVTKDAASVHGARIDSMMLVTVAITTIVFVLTQFLLFWFSYKYRGRENRKAYYYPHNNAIERLWTIVPAFVLTALVVFGFFTWRSITNPSQSDKDSALSLEVTGEQFKWNVRYAGDDNQLGLKNYKLTTPTNGLGIDFTDKKSWDDRLGPEIVLPVNKSVRVTINSKDVLHSFYMPDFKVQMNAVPGMATYFQFTPRFTTEEMREKSGNAKYDYVLLCAKICGSGHYNMQYKVRVVSDKEYKEWIVKQPLFFNDDMKKEMQLKSASLSKETLRNNKLAIN